MKKLICMLLILGILLSFSACNEKASSVDDNSGDAASQNEDIFSITENSLTYKVVTSPETVDYKTIKTLTITDNASNKELQTIRFANNEWFTNKPIYLVDITFDGKLDIVVPSQQPASAVYFQGYIWDDRAQEYVYAPSFEEIPNVALDKQNKTLLSHRTADKITSYGIHKYSESDKDFVNSRSLYWEPKADEKNMSVTESDYSKEKDEQVKKFSVPAIGELEIDKTDPQMSSYYEKNSIWDLDGDKWNDTLYKAIS